VNNNAVMNRMIVAGARRGVDRTAEFASRLGLSDSANVGTAVRERLSGALNDLERAERAGDADAIHLHEFRVQRARDEARAAREGTQPDQGVEEPPPSFDGGVQRRPLAPPGGLHETAGNLFRRAMETSRAERAQRQADPGQTIIANI
jgi:hypothetical protein